MTAAEQELGRRLLTELLGDLTPAPREPRFALKRGTFCAHYRVDVYPEVRAVKCRACGATLDAFAVVVGLARAEGDLEHYRGELRRISDEVAALRTEEVQTKARLKRARQELAKAEQGIAERAQERLFLDPEPPPPTRRKRR